MTDKERDALEVLKQGVSWRQASKKTKIPVERLKTLWTEFQKAEAARLAALADGS